MSIISEVILVGVVFLEGAAKTGLVRHSITIKKDRIFINFLKLMKKNFSLIFLIFFVLTAKSFAYDQNFNQINKNYNVKLEVFDNNKKITNFVVAIADNDEKRQYGLMNLKYLSSKKGMLFIFAEPSIINMWMKNTLISLDMIFINQNNEIVAIKEYATPKSLDVISSMKTVDKVLEINGGLSKKYGIKIGQKIVYENFRN